MKANKIITILAITTLSLSMAACGKKETVQDLPAETTEKVSVIDTETESEPETETEGVELVYNTETTEAVVAEGTVSAGTKDTSSTGSKTAGNTGSKNTTSGKSTDNKSASGSTGTKTNDNSSANTGTGNTNSNNNTNADTNSGSDNTQTTPPATNPSTPEPTPEPEPAPSQNLCPYPLWTWIDFGDGIVGFYSPSNEDADTFTAHCAQMQATIDANGYECYSSDLVGEYDDTYKVMLDKYKTN